jgi:ABC-type antimicrobial peptide transport system permease subunit
MPETQFTDSYLVAVIKSATNDPTALAGPARDELRRLDPTVPVFDVATLEARVSEASAQRVFVMRLLAGFAAVAVLLASIGLYGVVSYTVAQRTREVGVRVALGATPRDIVRLILSRVAALVVTGMGIGIIAALVATRFLDTLVFGVSPSDAPTYAASLAVLGTVALIAHLLPLRRALRVDPADALRHE